MFSKSAEPAGGQDERRICAAAPRYISVPRDLTRVKSKVLFGLTKRQIVCFGTGALIGVPVYFFVRGSGNLSLAALAMIVVMLPFFFFGLYERNGQPPEVVARHFYQARFVRPKIRPYQTNNYYVLALWRGKKFSAIISCASRSA